MRSFKFPALTSGVPHPVRLIAASLNLLTTQQPWAAQRLARHAGKTVKVSLSGFAVSMTIDANGQLEQSDDAIVPDVVLEIDPSKITISRLFDPHDRQDVAELVHISGQAALAQVVSDLARDLRPDPEDALAHWVGDLPAGRIVRGVKGLFSTLASGSQSLARNTAEYLSEETNALLGRPAMLMHISSQERMSQLLNALEAKQATLAAKIQRLNQRKGKGFKA